MAVPSRKPEEHKGPNARLASYIKADRPLIFFFLSSFKVSEVRTCVDYRLALCLSLFLISAIGYVAKGGPSFSVITS